MGELGLQRTGSRIEDPGPSVVAGGHDARVVRTEGRCAHRAIGLKHEPHLRGFERPSQHVFQLRRRRETDGLRGEQHAQLRIDGQLGECARGELAALRAIRLGARIVPLGHRVHGQRGHEPKCNEDHSKEPLKARAPSMGLGELPLDLALRAMPRPPGEDRLPEHVVEDLVPDVATLLDSAQDAPLRQRGQDGLQLLRRDPPELREVGDLVGELRPRWRHEMVEEPCCEVFLVAREFGHRSFEMLLDDALRASESRERRRAKCLRALGRLLVPDALHHELEVRRLDTHSAVVRLDCTEPSERGLDLPRSDLVENAVDEIRFDVHSDTRDLA